MYPIQVGESSSSCSQLPRDCWMDQVSIAYPVIAPEGVTPVLGCSVAWQPIRKFLTLSTVVSLSLANFFIGPLNVYTNRSACMFDWGLYGAIVMRWFLCWMWYISKFSDVNYLPLSETVMSGSPSLQKTLSSVPMMTSISVILFDYISGHFL